MSSSELHVVAGVSRLDGGVSLANDLVVLNLGSAELLVEDDSRLDKDAISGSQKHLVLDSSILCVYDIGANLLPELDLAVEDIGGLT